MSSLDRFDSIDSESPAKAVNSGGGSLAKFDAIASGKSDALSLWDATPGSAQPSPRTTNAAELWDATPATSPSGPTSGTSAPAPGVAGRIASAIGTSLGSSATGSAVLGGIKGAFDTVVDGPAQLLANSAADAYPKNWPGYDFFQKQKQIANQGVTDRSANFASATQDHPTAAKVGEVAGGVGGALALPMGTLGEGANLINKLIYAAKSGAIVGAVNPVDDASNFWANKAGGTVAGVAGGVIGYPVGALAGKAVGAVANGAANLIRPLTNKLTGAGADATAAVADASPELQAAVAKAVNRGENIDPAALSRQVEADSLPVKVSLTPGQASQNPMLISHEQNMRGANPSLGYRFNDQNTQLSQNIAAMKKDFAPEATSTNNYEASQSLIAAIQAKVDANKDNISGLYKKLSDANGGSLPLDGQSFAIEASKALGGLTGKAEFLPGPIQSILNNLQAARGNMDYSNFEALRTILATEARSNTNGNAVAAVNSVRKVLEEMPMTSEAAEVRPLADAARSAAKAHFDMMRDVPAYKAVANGTAEPDTFAKKFILGAPTSQVGGLAKTIADNPEALQELKAVGLHYLNDSAINQAGLFSHSGYNNALDKLAPKLPLLYGEGEAGQLKTLGNVATHVQARPAGSFVNSSNTETANLARGAGRMAGAALDAATHSPVGSFVNSVMQNSFEKKAAASKLNAMLSPGAGISSPGPTKDFLQSRLPVLSGQAGMVPLSSILGNFAANKGDTETDKRK